MNVLLDLQLKGGNRTKRSYLLEHVDGKTNIGGKDNGFKGQEEAIDSFLRRKEK
jgi:hypothetical protein